MPKQKDLKRVVRARMRKTGESYTAARARVLAKPPRAARAARGDDLARRAGMRDAAVLAKTGRDWRGWTRALDALDAQAWTHTEIARHLRTEHGLSAWWSQSVAGGYERIRGLRAIGQKRDGSHEMSKSRTFPVPVEALYAAWQARPRRRWLDGEELRITTARRDRVLRGKLADGTPLQVHFTAKGPAKSQVQLQERVLPSRAHADRRRALWHERLTALGEHLRGG